MLVAKHLLLELVSKPTSLLNHTRAMIALRRKYSALRIGSFEGARGAGDLLYFKRVSGDELLHCYFNLGGNSVAIEAADSQIVAAVNGAELSLLPPYAALVTRG